MDFSHWRLVTFGATVAGMLIGIPCSPAAAAGAAPAWEWAGWGGGGYFFSAVFHPARDGVIYMGGDVAGVYKSEDHGQHWRMINRGLADYAVYSLAADPTATDTVYAATEGGLCKSTDGGEHWRLLPKTGPKDLRITGERKRSVRAVAVDPSDSRIVYAASPAGKVFKSADGGETWTVAWETASEPEPPGTLRLQFGKVNDAWHGGFWFPLAFPAGADASTCTGLGFGFKGDGTLPRDCFLSLKTADGIAYRSRNLRDVFGRTQWGEVVLGAADFALDPEWAKAHAAQAAAYSGTPDWARIARLDFGCVGPLMDVAPVGKFSRFYFTFAGTPPRQVTFRDFATNATVQTYGNLRAGEPAGNPVCSVAVAPKEPARVLAASAGSGLLLSRDAGRTWRKTAAPDRVACAAFAAADPSVAFAACFEGGLWKSVDAGETWKRADAGLPEGCSVIEVAVSPSNTSDVCAIGEVGWNGRFFRSADGGTTWTNVTQLKPDLDANPTLATEFRSGTAGLSSPRSVTINPLDPREIFIAANWRPCFSADGGRTWTERSRGADISCVYDLRFHKGRTYAAAMDEGVLVSGDDGRTWRALWPLKYDTEISGHHWRLAISDGPDGDRIVSTCSPWNSRGPNRVVFSGDGGRTFAHSFAGLPEKNPHANTMWGVSHPRALAADPADPKILYLGLDGDPTGDGPGGGAFKSVDGGRTWAPLPAQPGSRRVFFGLAVDPTERRRLYWGGCASGGGLYRSEDGGASWEHVFRNETWVFNVHVAADGAVYCPGNNLWRSADHGKSWKKLTAFPFSERIIVAIETDPSDPKRIWFAATTWGNAPEGGVYESCDGGASWLEITGDLPYRKPLVLRYNPATRELWSAGVCLFKCRR